MRHDLGRGRYRQVWASATEPPLALVYILIMPSKSSSLPGQCGKSPPFPSPVQPRRSYSHYGVPIFLPTRAVWQQSSFSLPCAAT